MGKKKGSGKKKSAASAPAKPTGAAKPTEPTGAARASADKSAPQSSSAGVTPVHAADHDEATPVLPPPVPPPAPEKVAPFTADPPTGSTEKRLFRRIPFFRKIQFKFESMDAFKSEFANDISIGGMFIKTDAPEPVGSVVFLRFDLKDGSKILSGYGKVVRVNPKGQPDFDPGMGVEFLKFDEESLLRVKQLVAERFDDR
ncbi:MAG TPA: PilZ domain-containing protein [bacterium]|nr:PilZ domain-containing protein [bacterium]